MWISTYNEKPRDSHEKSPNSRCAGISLPREPILDSVIVWGFGLLCGGLFFIFFGACGGLFLVIFRRLRRALLHIFSAPAAGSSCYLFRACGGLFFIFVRRLRRALFCSGKSSSGPKATFMRNQFRFQQPPCAVWAPLSKK